MAIFSKTILPGRLRIPAFLVPIPNNSYLVFLRPCAKISSKMKSGIIFFGLLMIAQVYLNTGCSSTHKQDKALIECSQYRGDLDRLDQCEKFERARFSRNEIFR